MESTASRMNRLGRSVLMDTPLLTLEETIERLDAVDPEQLLELARLLFPPTRLSAAAIGRDEGRFRNALEPVGVAA
jgi:predicted Zn-dependent peptidase